MSKARIEIMDGWYCDWKQPNPVRIWVNGINVSRSVAEIMTAYYSSDDFEESDREAMTYDAEADCLLARAAESFWPNDFRVCLNDVLGFEFELDEEYDFSDRSAPKFQVGDYVRVTHKLDDWEGGESSAANERYVGHVGVVMSVEDGPDECWPEGMFHVWFIGRLRTLPGKESKAEFITRNCGGEHLELVSRPDQAFRGTNFEDYVEGREDIYGPE